MYLTSDRATREVLKAITMQKQLKSALLRLPAEIRTQIYEYALHDTCISTCQAGSGCPITHKFCSDMQECQGGMLARRRQIDWSSRCKFFQHVHFPKDRLQLLQVCRQIYTEAKLLVFSSNTLAGRVPKVNSFLVKNNWSAEKMNAIKTVKLVCGLREICLAAGSDINNKLFGPSLTLEGLANLQGLKKVIFHLICYGPELESHKTFGDHVKALLEVAINGRRSADDTIELQYAFEQQDQGYRRF